MTRLLICLALAATLPACERSTEGYCCTDLATCLEPGGTPDLRPCDDPARSFCDNSGTFAASEGIGRTCIPDPGGRSCDAPTDCMSPLSPVCDLAGVQECIGCSAAADCTAFAGRPLCHPQSGACVECVGATDCPMERPTCDPDGLCRECTSDNECTSQLCNQLSGSCVPEDEVIYVGMGGSGTACTRSQPCGSWQVAVDQVTTTRDNIHVSSGTYTERVVVDNHSFYLSGPSAELVAPATGTGPVLSITGTSVVELDSIRIRDATGVTGDGVDCSGGFATLTLRRAIIEDNENFGVESTNCRLTVTRSRIDGNAGGGIKASGGEVTLQNNFVVGNGSASTTFGGLDLSASMLAVEFNTIADNLAAPGLAAGARCQSTLMRIITSNIIVGAGARQVDTMNNCTFIYTISNEAITGTGNRTTLPTFVDALMGNYHLAAGSAGIDVADPAATVNTDVDGDLRPAGAASDIGADEVVP